MKKHFIAITISFMFVSSYAQTTFKGFELGIQVAMNFSNITGLSGGVLYDDVTTQNKSLLRPGLFLFGTKSLSEEFYIKPGIGINFKGGKNIDTEEDYGSVYTDVSTDRFSYLEIPLLFGYRATEKLSLETGVSLGFPLSSESTFEESGGGYNNSETEDLSSFIKGQELGFHIGAKYAIDSRFSAGARYFSGSDINKSQFLAKITLKGFAFFLEMKI